MHPDITTSLVTEPALIWLVRFTGLAMGAAVAVFVLDTVIQILRSER